MQVLVIIGVLGVVSLLGVGYMGNDVELWIQSFGVGDGLIESPVIGTDLSLIIDTINTPNGPGDFITFCEFTSIDSDLLAGTKLYCKLYDGADIITSYIIATGFVELVQDVPMGTTIPIEIDNCTITCNTIGGSNSVNFVVNALVEVQEP